MRKKITSLTPEQELRLVEFREEYLAHGLSTEPADRPRAEAAFARAYERIGKDPVPVIWVGSPLSASIVLSAIKSGFRDSLGGGLSASIRNGLANDLEARDGLRSRLAKDLKNYLEEGLGESIRDNLRINLSAILRNGLEASVSDNVAKVIWDSLIAKLKNDLNKDLARSLESGLQSRFRAILVASFAEILWSNLGSNLADSIEETLENTKIEAQHTYWWGQQDMYWIVYYLFCQEIGIQYTHAAADGLDIMNQIGRSCMWWYPRDGLIVACDRPALVQMDEASRLHSDTGPAIAFRDGWKLHFVHGVRVPEWIIENPDLITVESIELEGNTEIQRVMVERFGWDRYVDEGGFEIVDHDERWGTLLRRGQYLAVRVVNRSPEPDGITFRNYVLPVAPSCEPLGDELGEPQKLTALNAVASTFGMTGKEYERVLAEES